MERAAAALIALNALFLAGVFGDVMWSWSEWTTDPPMPEALHAEAPTGYRPLAGTSGFSGDKDAACEALQIYLTDLGGMLHEAGSRPPLDHSAMERILKDTDCAVTHPAVKDALRRYAEAMKQANLPLSGPLVGL